MIPDFSDADMNNNLPMMTLKSRCAQSKPLGIVRCDGSDELLIIYDGTQLLAPVTSTSDDLNSCLAELGCYTDKYGVPSRFCGYLRWEIKAVAYSHRGAYVLLFSPEFIEVRTVQTGKLVRR